MRKVIGIGHAAAGDDAVALRVVELLAGCADVVLRKCMDPTDLIGEMDGASDMILVDALVGAGNAGEVRWLDLENLREERVADTHGMTVVSALELASRVLAELPPVRILGICIDPPRGFDLRLSAAAEDGAARAASMIREALACTNPL